jgi:DNA adenine methylase
MTVARPFVKWPGGKTQLLPELLARVPKEFDTYHEPFVGGGALFWKLQPKRAVLSDSNTHLIDAYCGVRDEVDTVIEKLQDHACVHDADHYAFVRGLVGTVASMETVAAWVIYLNKTCFNGLWRVNKSGRFNVPMGKFKTPPKICDEENLQACAEVLQGVDLCAQPVKAALQRVNPGDFVYLDPPYVPLSTTANFTGYTAEGFGPADQIDLAYAAADLKAKGAHVLLSNAGTVEVIDLYQSLGFAVDIVQARRSINSKGSARGPVHELLIY